MKLYFRCNGEFISPWPLRFKRIFYNYSKFRKNTYDDVLKDIYKKGEPYSKLIKVLKNIISYGYISCDTMDESLINNIFILSKICGITLNVAKIQHLNLIPQEALTYELCLDIIYLTTAEKIYIASPDFFVKCKMIKYPDVSKYFECLDDFDFIDLLRESWDQSSCNGAHMNFLNMVKYVYVGTKRIDIQRYGNMICKLFNPKLPSYVMLKLLDSIVRINKKDNFVEYIQHFSLLASIDLNYLEIESEFINRIVTSNNLPFSDQMLKIFFTNIYSIDRQENIYSIYRQETFYVKPKILSGLEKIISSNFDFFVAMVIALNSNYNKTYLHMFIEHIIVEVHNVITIDYNGCKLFSHPFMVAVCKDLYKYNKYDLTKIKLDGITFEGFRALVVDSGHLTKSAIKK